MLVNNMVNSVLYDGGIRAAFFGKNGPKWTICLFLWTCCQWDSTEVMEEDDPNKPDLRNEDSDNEKGNEKNKFGTPNSRYANNANDSTHIKSTPKTRNRI